jgi:hypothetical protein
MDCHACGANALAAILRSQATTVGGVDVKSVCDVSFIYP